MLFNVGQRSIGKRIAVVLQCWINARLTLSKQKLRVALFVSTYTLYDLSNFISFDIVSFIFNRSVGVQICLFYVRLYFH